MIVTRQVEIDYGHTLPDHYSFCNQIHGHRAKVVAHFEGAVHYQDGDTSNGMVLDFGICKNIMMDTIHNQLDHGFAVWEKDASIVNIPSGVATTPYNTVVATMSKVSTLAFIKARNKKVLICEHPPTAEYLAMWADKQIRAELSKVPGSIEVVKVEWWETPNNCAIYESPFTAFVTLNRTLGEVVNEKR